MKLEFSTKLNIIREKRRLRGQGQTIEIENKQNQLKSEEIIPTKEKSNNVNTEDANILLQKMHFMNNPSSHEQNKQKKHISITSMNKHNHAKIENNEENIYIIVSEIIPHAKSKFY